MEKEKTNSIIHHFFKIFSIILILTFCLLLYAHYLNPQSLTVKEIAVYDESLNSEYNGFKIAHFSDLHYGRTTKEDNLKKVVKELNKLNADIVIFTGDLFDNKNISEEEENLLIDYLNQINARLFKFAIIGDYDQEYLNTYKNILEASNFILLDNESTLVYYQSSTPLNFIGLTNTDDIADLYNNDYFNITLIHQPDLSQNITNSNLIFAGHSLGGQIRLPFIGGIKKIDGAKTYIDEYYQLDNTKLYISNGIGTQDYSLRFLNTPSITLYRLYNS